MEHIRMKLLRKKYTLSCQQVAKFISVETSVYLKYEKGNIPIPLNKIINLAHLYNTSIDYIAGLTNVSKAYSLK